MPRPGTHGARGRKASRPAVMRRPAGGPALPPPAPPAGSGSLPQPAQVTTSGQPGSGGSAAAADSSATRGEEGTQ
eukprot:12898523-Prorocentrum_lima.AAC.1